MILDDIPNSIDVGRVIGMAEPIAEINHFLPLDIRRVPFDFISKLRVASQTTSVPLGRHAAHFIRGEQMKAAACEHAFDLDNRFQNVQPVFDGWRHSELYLDQIVGDPFGNAGFQQIRIDICLEARGVLDQMQDEQIERWRVA